MKINPTDLQSRLSIYQAAQSQGSSRDVTSIGKTEMAAPSQDRVALSAQGQLIADAQRAIQFIPDVRESLVSRIQADLQNGTYRVDSQQAAEGLLRESLVNQAAMF